MTLPTTLPATLQQALLLPDPVFQGPLWMGVSVFAGAQAKGRPFLCQTTRARCHVVLGIPEVLKQRPPDTHIHGSLNYKPAG